MSATKSFLTLIALLVISAFAWAQERPPLVLQPKAALKTEAAPWTHAPLVPPPIQRQDQRRLVVNWTASEIKAEIAPGVIYDDYWAFEGKVPGPVVRMREGDLLEVHLTNHISSMRNHNIDFHFVMGPGGGASALNVAPGEKAVLEVRATAPGFYMFHCATPDIPTHVANGMYGYVIIEPAEGLPPVDREYYVVQSELYTTDGKKGHQSFSMARGEKFDAEYVVFNGAVGSMMGANALKANVGETVRLWVGNAGPNFISSFHVIGQIFSKVYREGDLLSAPGRAIQTTLIPAGGSSVVEFRSDVPGTYLLVDHAIFRLHRGAAGSIVINGAKNAEVYDAITAGAKAEAMSDHDHVAAPAPAAETKPAAPAEKPAAKPASKPARSVLRKTTAQVMPAVLTGPVTGISASYFPPEPAPEAMEAMAPASAGPVAAGGVTIRMLPGAGNYDTDESNDFSQPVVRIKAGSSVTWLNTDNMVHFNQDDKGEFKTPILKSGERYTHTFKKPGTYNYVCVPHPWMKGKIVVR
jgi:copper-containing nitrite reductase/amicyanin